MSDYETTQRKRNIIVGVFVVVAVCSFAWLIYKFGDLPIKISELSSFKVYVQFPIAQGVSKNTPVRFCGYPIGKVTKVEPPKVLRDLNTSKFYHQTIVVLNIDDKYSNIPSNVNVKLMTRGLGSSYIELVVDPELPPTPRDPNKPETCFLIDKMWLQGSTGMTSEFFPEESQKKLDDLIKGLNSLIANANDIIGNKKNKENFGITLANMSEASKQAALTLKEFEKFLITGTTTLKDADVQMEKAVTSMMSTSEELNETLKQLRLILIKVNDGEGTAARLINDGQLYENLLEDAEHLDTLLKELSLLAAQWREKGVKLK